MNSRSFRLRPLAAFLAPLGLALAAPAGAQVLNTDGFVGPFRLEAPAEAKWASYEADIAAGRDGARKLATDYVEGRGVSMIGARTARLDFPIREKSSVKSFTGFGISNYVDLNDAQGALQDYTCGTRTYDLPDGYDHAGIDIFSAPFPWTAMENSEVLATAAYAGVITAMRSGEPDRSCALDTPSALPNYVAVRQDDGYLAYYFHFKTNSIPAGLQVGSRVAKGDVLGVVGSSGFSSGPHLHFELRDDQNRAVDPMSGACQAQAGLFSHQWAYRDTRVMRIGTLGGPPVFPSDRCVTETSNLKTVFQPGEQLYIAPFIRDLLPGQFIEVRLYRPDGTQYSSTSTTSNNSEPFGWAYYYWFWTLPANVPAGTWRARVTLAGVTYEQAFQVGAAPAAAGPIFGATLPGSRSVSTGTTATAFATILNSGAQTARGCTIAPAAPIDADFSFQTTNPATNALSGTANTAVDIAAGAAQTFLIALTPRAGSKSTSYDLPFKFNCLNSDAAPMFANLNTLKLSFETGLVPDLIALAGTVGNTGVVRPAGPSAAAAFVVAATNIGAPASLTVTPRKTRSTMPGTISICETVPATGACKATPSASVTRSFAANENTTWSIFFQAAGDVPFDPAGTRITVDFEDANLVSRGSTSVAARTD